MTGTEMVHADVECAGSVGSVTPSFGVWQPIETAPKDGSDVLCHSCGFGMGMMVLYWFQGYWREKANGMGLKREPTHWMPLPPAPQNADRTNASADATGA